MSFTRYHAKYFAYELTRQLPSNDIGKLTASLQDAQVDLNPHQVEAALFAFKSPLSNGAILADEVGLGKTIEAGIILSQQWAERKRTLLIIGPSNLRKQWNQELADKFFLPSTILETKSFNQQIKAGNLNPFDQKDSIVICSFQFAKSKAAYLQHTPWDLVIIDEAHRLRNVYKPNNVIGNAIKHSLQSRKKVLLTATPLQNSILELYGLVSIIDEFVFGDLKSFKSRYNHQLTDEDYQDLKTRLEPVCKRTLRRQVLEYINYTERRAIREEFYPTDQEQLLYDLVSEYLQRPRLYALPSSQRQLMTLILRKLLASSTFAIYGTLVGLVVKLESILERDQAMYDNIGDLEQDYNTYDELEDEWEGDEDEAPAKADEPLTEGDIKAIQEEIEDLKKFRELAKVIKVNSKANHLITALERAFAQLQLLGAQQKALIFTESRRTQNYLLDLLQTSGYEGKVMVFNGSNNDPKSNEIYQVWLREHNGTDIITGSPSADKRAALVDYFREEATIMIATEAAAEGVNLQFCSLVVNYDLPWNPQRIEQRIGRCHRYGQKFDVVVVNFLNKKNAADIRVYELLADKFQLFDGVFGASDEVLGTIGNGTDFEKRIAQIYNECRSTEEIQQAFDLLQEELKPEITEKMQGVRTALLENFDESVRERLRMDFNKSKENLSLFEHKLWKITNYYLEDYAEFVEEDYSFELFDYPSEPISVNLGFYKILRSDDSRKKSDIEIPENTNIYRIGHKLAQQILTACKEAPTPVREVVFDYSNTPTIITLLEKFIGHSGWLRVEFLTINSFEQEEYLLAGAFTESGDMLDPETALRLFSLNAQEGGPVSFSDDVSAWFRQVIDHERATVLNENALRNRDFFDIEMDKLDLWADDMKLGLEREIKDLDAEIKLRKAEAKKILKLEDKVKAQRHIKDLERKRSESRRMLFTAQDEVDDKKDQLLTSIEKMLNQKISQKELFTIQWKIV